MRNKGPSFAALAREYLRSLDAYRDAKAAVAVARRIGHDAREMEHHAASVQGQHQDAFGALVDLAVQLRDAAALREAAP